ncbi:hypothetical protein ACVBE9_01800 [Eionea flava]
MNGGGFYAPKFSTILKDHLCAIIGLELMLSGLLEMTPDVLAHTVIVSDKRYIQETKEVHAIPFIYLGAEHMMTWV